MADKEVKIINLYFPLPIKLLDENYEPDIYYKAWMVVMGMHDTLKIMGIKLNGR